MTKVNVKMKFRLHNPHERTRILVHQSSGQFFLFKQVFVGDVNKLVQKMFLECNVPGFAIHIHEAQLHGLFPDQFGNVRRTAILGCSVSWSPTERYSFQISVQ